MANGIDVSQWQGEIKWQEVTADFVIMRAGYGKLASQRDIRFESNYKGCRERNIPCGAYWFAYATTPEEAKMEAEACLSVINGKRFEYPIFYDVEDKRILEKGRESVSAIISAFLDTLEKSGYFAGLYMSSDALMSYTDDDIRKRYAIWVADYGVSKPTYPGNYGIWQRSSTGTMKGIEGFVDIDESYVDYPSIIKSAGLNGWKNDVPVDPKHKLTVIIDGKTIVRDYGF